MPPSWVGTVPCSVLDMGPAIMVVGRGHGAGRRARETGARARSATGTTVAATLDVADLDRPTIEAPGGSAGEVHIDSIEFRGP